MKYDEMILMKMPIREAVTYIYKNTSLSFSWFPVVGKGGCIVELGGRNSDVNEGLELKVYVPVYGDDGIPVRGSNGYVEQDYSMDKYGVYTHDGNCMFKHDVQHNIDFIGFLINTDFRKWTPNISTMMVPAAWTGVLKLNADDHLTVYVNPLD